MAAVGAQEAQLGRLDVLQFGGEKAAVAGIKPQRLAQIQELQGARLKKGGREAFRSVIDMKENETPYRHESTSQFESRFGAGEAKYDAAGRRVSQEPVTPEKKAIYDEAKRLIEQSTRVLSYLEISATGNPTATLATLQKTRPELAGLSMAQLRDGALDTIAADPAFQKLFLELRSSGVTDTARRAIIEDTLASDPRFRARLGARMETIYEQAQKLPEVKGADAIQKAEADRLTIEASVEKTADDAAKILQAKGLKLTIPPSTTPVDATKDNIKQILANITDEGIAKDKLSVALLGCSEADYKLLKRFRVALPERQKQIEDEIAKMPPPRNLITAGKGMMQQEYTAIKKEIQDLELKRARQDQPWSDLNKTYTSMERELSDTGLASLGATSLWEVYTKNMVSAQSQLAQKDAEIALIQKAAPTPEGLQSERMRLIEETKLLNSLETALSNALVDVMEDRYDAMMPLEEERLMDAAKKAEDDNKVELAAAIKRLGEKMNKKWLGYDKASRKRAPHKDAIKKDMQRLIYSTNNEEEIKRMLIEDSSLPKPKDSTGVEIDWSKVDITTGMFDTGRKDAAGKPIMEKADLTLVKDMYLSQKDAYTQKLFKSYFATRGMGDRTFLGMASNDAKNLGLKNHEWVLLEEQYGNQITEALMSDKNGRAALDKLKGEGVIADFKLKWLLYLVMMLVGGVALGAPGALAGIGAAAALGGGAGTIAGAGIGAGTLGALGGAKAAGAINDRIL